MAFGRSNSLSLNTGAANSLLGANDPPQFAPIPDDIINTLLSTTTVSATPTTTTASTVLLKPTESPDMFGTGFMNAPKASQNPPANNTSSSQQNNNPAPAAGGSIFGNNTSNTTNNTSSIFGNANTTTNTQQTQPAATSGLFGNTNTNTQQNQPAAGGSLFGNTGASQPAAGGSLFGNTGASQPAAGGSLFGNTTTNNNASTLGGSMFGSANNTANANNMFSRPAAQPAPTGSLFGAAASTNNNNAGSSSMFGSRQNAPSLLGATQASSMNQNTPFGRLGMGQSTSAPATQAAAQVTIDNLKGTTRFEDCADSVRQELENLDKMIQQQEQYAKQIEAFLPKHEEDVNSLLPDIDFVKDKADDVEQSLATDAQGVDAQRKNAEKDSKDVQRLQRIVTNLALPQPYQYPNLSTSSMYASQQRTQQPQTAQSGDQNYDTDLINNYFLPMAAELQKSMDSYASNLGEIEQHMRVIESSTIQQAQQLAQRRSGIGGAQRGNGEDTVRELASTLRGFEESILGVAGIVGDCREGVTQLALGRLGTHLGGVR